MCVTEGGVFTETRCACYFCENECGGLDWSLSNRLLLEARINLIDHGTIAVRIPVVTGFMHDIWDRHRSDIGWAFEDIHVEAL